MLYREVNRGTHWLSGSVGLEIEGLLVRDSHEALCCVTQLDTLFSAKYWFNTGIHEMEIALHN